ncbi:hypothetical protein GNI_111840 [Gregarina niphandrodes]|uniref:Uncharacterized protein n=1 Tax=Gregarina niphandrodes TaxID=110365 RepID=A0A023B3F8_GRENI|nr:hypothetical protein GNI_111840 [Gregarina niphandrodes]EZG55489.1 hypothetical protein GNI_111840 [Gregarina niphandrodes]|eukprot:XP_011131533.1 hypothetical protein GNI_111840 [Gregarina niphandrodes]
MSLHLAEWPETEKSVSLTLEFNDWNGRTDTCELSVHIDDERNMVDLKRFWEQQFFDIWEKVFGYGRERFD